MGAGTDQTGTTVVKQDRKSGIVRTTIYLPRDIHTRAKANIPNISAFVVFHLKEHLHDDMEHLSEQIAELEHVLKHKKTLLHQVIKARSGDQEFVDSLVRQAATQLSEAGAISGVAYGIGTRIRDRHKDYSRQQVDQLVRKVMKRADVLSYKVAPKKRGEA